MTNYPLAAHGQPGLRLSTGLCLVLALSAVGGCARLPPEGPPTGISSVTLPAANEPLRVAVMPLWLGESVGRSAAVASEALGTALREYGRHQVVSVPMSQRDELMPGDPVGRNQVTTADLLRVRDRTGADAVLIGRVDQYRAYDPVLMGLTAHLISVHDGSVLWSATAVFDGQRFDVQADIERWWATIGDANTPIASWRTVLQSPSQFARYATWRLINTMAPAPLPKPPVAARR